MKYTNDEAFTEVIKRSRTLKIKHEKKVTTLLSVSASIAAVTMILTIGVFGGVAAGTFGSAYGSFLLPTQAGGYVLAAVVAFAAGIGTTLGVQKYRKNRENKDLS